MKNTKDFLETGHDYGKLTQEKQVHNRMWSISLGMI